MFIRIVFVVICYRNFINITSPPISQGYRRLGEFIVTPHPLQSTKDDFWRMVWGQNSRLIVLLHPIDAATLEDDLKSDTGDYVNVGEKCKDTENEEASQYGSEYANNVCC